MSFVSEQPLLSPEFLNRLEQLELVSRKVLRGRLKGDRRSKRRGQSVEFADYRNYVVGDDLRFIDWNTYARLDRLFLKLYEEEEDLHFSVLIDASGSMEFGEPTKFRYAQQVAAALGFVGLFNSDQVVVEAIQQPAKQRSPRLRGRASIWRLLKHVEQIQPSDEPMTLADGIKNFFLRHRSRQGIVVLISDLLDKTGYEPALRMLVASQMDVYVIQTLCPEELDPPLTGDLRLVDAEDGDIAEVSITQPLLARYKKTLEAFVGGVRTFCARRGMIHLLANTGEPIEDLITKYLRQRGLVK